jgi:hypothetical protein
VAQFERDPNKPEHQGKLWATGSLAQAEVKPAAFDSDFTGQGFHQASTAHLFQLVLALGAPIRPSEHTIPPFM